jgi:hypothetical protein
MTRWVKLRTGEGQHFDRAVGLHIRNDEKKPLPKPVPAGSLTAQRLDMGALVYCDPPDDAVEVIEVEEAGDDRDATEGAAELTDDRQDVGHDSAEKEEEPAPTPPTKKKPVRRKAKP